MRAEIHSVRQPREWQPLRIGIVRRRGTVREPRTKLRMGSRIRRSELAVENTPGKPEESG